MSRAAQLRASLAGYGLASAASALDGTAGGAGRAMRLARLARPRTMAEAQDRERAILALGEQGARLASEGQRETAMDREFLIGMGRECPLYERCQVGRGHVGPCDPRTEYQRMAALFAAYGDASAGELRAAADGLEVLLRHGRLPPEGRAAALALIAAYMDDERNVSRAARVVVAEWPSARRERTLHEVMDLWGDEVGRLAGAIRCYPDDDPSDLASFAEFANMGLVRRILAATDPAGAAEDLGEPPGTTVYAVIVEPAEVAARLVGLR